MAAPTAHLHGPRRCGCRHCGPRDAAFDRLSAALRCRAGETLPQAAARALRASPPPRKTLRMAAQTLLADTGTWAERLLRAASWLGWTVHPR